LPGSRASRDEPIREFDPSIHGSMRLAFDLDGTLADLQSALGRAARDLFPDVDPTTLPRSVGPEAPARASGDPASSAEPDSPLGIHTLTPRQQRELWGEVCNRENFWETLDEIEPGALARLDRLVRDRRWELVFLTSRPDTVGDTPQLQSHRWLVAHGCPAPSIFVVHGSRGKIASALQLDVVVDDRPENCLDVAIDSSARTILVWRGGEETVPASARQLGIGAVTSVAECLDILEQFDGASTDRSGVVERFKRLLGLKPRAARLLEPARPQPAQSTGPVAK
jgi:hypothetical protein